MHNRIRPVLFSFAALTCLAEFVFASAPTGLTIGPNGPGSSISILEEGPEREGLIKAISTINDLNSREAAAVLFVRAAMKHQESALVTELINQWAEILHVEILTDNPAIETLAEEHDLSLPEAQLVTLVRGASDRQPQPSEDPLTAATSALRERIKARGQ